MAHVNQYTEADKPAVMMDIGTGYKDDLDHSAKWRKSVVSRFMALNK